jgi:serine/threonine protein kinase
MRAAQRIDDHIDEENIQSTCFRAPEVVLGHPWSTAADIWSFACTVSLVRIGGLPIGLHYRLTYPSSGVQDIRDCNRRRTLRGLDGRAAPRDRGMLGRR